MNVSVMELKDQSCDHLSKPHGPNWAKIMQFTSSKLINIVLNCHQYAHLKGNLQAHYVLKWLMYTQMLCCKSTEMCNERHTIILKKNYKYNKELLHMMFNK